MCHSVGLETAHLAEIGVRIGVFLLKFFRFFGEASVL